MQVMISPPISKVNAPVIGGRTADSNRSAATNRIPDIALDGFAGAKKWRETDILASRRLYLLTGFISTFHSR